MQKETSEEETLQKEKTICGDDICTFHISKNGCQWGDKCKKIHFEEHMHDTINNIFNDPLKNLSESFIEKVKISNNIEEFFKKKNITDKYQMVIIIIQNAVKKAYNKENQNILNKINIRMCRDKKSENKNIDKKEFIEINIRIKNEETKKLLRFYYYKYDRYNNNNKNPIFFMSSTFILNHEFKINDFIPRYVRKSYNSHSSNLIQSPLDLKLEEAFGKKGIKLGEKKSNIKEIVKETKDCPNNSEENFPSVIKLGKIKINTSDYRTALKSNKNEISKDVEEVSKEIINKGKLQREISEISNISELGSPIRKDFPSEFNDVTKEIWEKMASIIVYTIRIY